MSAAPHNIPFKYRRVTRSTFLPAFLLATLVLLVLAPLCLSFGPETLSLGSIARAFLGTGEDSVISTIIFELRLPRVLLAISVGAALSMTGATFQALLKNPLAEPYILGVSNGCAVGAILGFLLGISQAGITGLSFAGGLVVVLMVLWIGRRSLGTGSDAMLLGGVMVAAIGAAILFLLLHLLGAQVRSAIQWMLGDLSGATPEIGYISIGLFGALLVASFFSGNIMNALALGEEQAAALGLNVKRATVLYYIGSSLVVGITTSFCGAIGFVGLVVPHIVRRIVGPDHRLLLPLTVVVGGSFLLVCDTIARSLLPLTETGGGELPVGAVTALFGAPLFIWLLKNSGKR